MQIRLCLFCQAQAVVTGTGLEPTSTYFINEHSTI